MCGRFSLTSPVEAIRRLFGVEESPNLQARYNIAPTTNIIAIRSIADLEGNKTELFKARWGLIPSWAKSTDFSAKMINARSETAKEKPAFRAAYENRRCLIPANGFYEWQKLDKTTKQPWFIKLKTAPLFAFAGLWESWVAPDGEEIESCTILTTLAAESIAFIHHRMPVIIDENSHKDWLLGNSNESLLGPTDNDKLEFYKVSKRVGNVRNDDADLIRNEENTQDNRQQDLF
jgi:putative SOS response-associated peptidase YedK